MAQRQNAARCRRKQTPIRGGEEEHSRPLPVDSEPTIQPSSAGSTTSSQLFPTLPFQMPAIHFHTGTGSLVNGTGGYMASPSKTAPAIKKPATSEITSDILYAIPAKRFPAIREFLATVDQEEADGEDSPNYSQYADRLIEKGFRRIHLLFDETPKSLRTELELPITIGDCKATPFARQARMSEGSTRVI